jgi:hypothetical protein
MSEESKKNSAHEHCLEGHASLKTLHKKHIASGRKKSIESHSDSAGNERDALFFQHMKLKQDAENALKTNKMTDEERQDAANAKRDLNKHNSSKDAMLKSQFAAYTRVRSNSTKKKCLKDLKRTKKRSLTAENAAAAGFTATPGRRKSSEAATPPSSTDEPAVRSRSGTLLSKLGKGLTSMRSPAKADSKKVVQLNPEEPAEKVEQLMLPDAPEDDAMPDEAPTLESDTSYPGVRPSRLTGALLDFLRFAPHSAHISSCSHQTKDS